MKSADKLRTRRNPRTFVVTFWSAGAVNRRKEISTRRVQGFSRAEVLGKVEGTAPQGTAKVTVASPLHFRSHMPAHLSLTQQIAAAEPGTVFWVQGIPPTWQGARARKRCDYTVFYAFPFAQARTGDDVSACERVRLTRITVLGNRMEVDDEASQERQDDPAAA